jgi:hypothetical protein
MACMTMDALKTTHNVGLDLLTLTSHTLHAMQPLDASCFKPFKQAFRSLRVVWTLHNKSKGPSKEVLEKWVSTALEKALCEKNIKSGFCTTMIFPLNLHTMDEKIDPLEFYREVPTHINGVLGNLHTLDLDATENLNTVNDTFIKHCLHPHFCI